MCSEAQQKNMQKPKCNSCVQQSYYIEKTLEKGTKFNSFEQIQSDDLNWLLQNQPEGKHGY